GFQAGGFSAIGGTATKLRMLHIEEACWGDTQALPGF
ncbi:MAG: cysteine methyltransferase, partial [Verminephrobacter sp.]|nr:cysteine methyltransferase [Verminephrobacter sp.]